MSFNHVTYHVPTGTLGDRAVEHFFTLLGFHEVIATDAFEHGWKVRWFKDSFSDSPLIHLVEGVHNLGDGRKRASHLAEGYTDQDLLALGHFCVARPNKVYVGLGKSRYCVRNSGSGRIWLQFANLRVEVRPL